MISYDNFTVKEKGIGVQDIWKALAGGHFITYYQPIVETETGRLAGAEALVRWRHHELGIIPPSQFIKIAEETGLIIHIGKRVIRKVCEQLMLWRKEGMPLIPVSINISAQQFSQKDFVREVRLLLNEYQLQGRLLIFEIAETSLIRDEAIAASNLNELKRIGIKIYSDRFGTGHSSLSYLNSFPLDGIKIDRSFIENISREHDNAVITSGLIGMSRNLGINVIAEGVETEEELQFLRGQNCPQVQGFLFGQPCSAEEFKPLLLKEVVTPVKREKVHPETHTYDIKIRYPFRCEMTLTGYPGESVQQEPIAIEIENMGPGGLRFVSNLELSVGQEMLYTFKPEELEGEIQVAGVVIWSEELTSGNRQYGVHFNLSSDQRHYLAPLLKQYSKIYF
ncbi:EAL domain-containing protein [Mesobacillus campisalis]|uniref:EAL domain-containing protein n=1 Tax=Mesobacillus campisalis TaxID=1408103 RepID=UPI00069C9696|nr:EAL domain-containing protein [Mesobacillus campisalis]